MSRDFDDIYKKIDQSHKELHKQDSNLLRDINDVNKNQEKILREISDIKKEVKDISFKVDTMLEILNSFTIMIAEDDESLEDDYEYDTDSDSDETWVPKEDDFWENDDE